jgi:hypothetical protein
MEQTLWSLDLDTLKLLYDKEAAALRTALINGASWEDVKEQRKIVTDLAITLHKKRMGFPNPAESKIRDTPDF